MDKEARRKLERATELGTEIAKVLEVAGYGPRTELLGPSLIVLGILLAAKMGEGEMAFRAISTTGRRYGIVPDVEALVAAMKADPRAFVEFTRTVMGGKVEVVEVCAHARRKFPWRD